MVLNNSYFLPVYALIISPDLSKISQKPPVVGLIPCLDLHELSHAGENLRAWQIRSLGLDSFPPP